MGTKLLCEMIDMLNPDKDDTSDSDNESSTMSRCQSARVFYKENWTRQIENDVRLVAKFTCKIIHILKGTDKAYLSFEKIFQKINKYPLDHNDFSKRRAEQREKKAIEDAKLKKISKWEKE
jgi:hypothetical protein